MFSLRTTIFGMVYDKRDKFRSLCDTIFSHDVKIARLVIELFVISYNVYAIESQAILAYRIVRDT